MEFTGGNSTREYRLQFPAHAEEVGFRFHLYVDEGTVLWFLIHPAGETRWSGRKNADADPARIRGDIDGPAGDWKLVIEMRQTDGRYPLDWEAR